MVTSFPNEDAAAKAANEMDATDFAVSDENRRVGIPGHPTAKARYRPLFTSPSVGATMASGRLVVSVVAHSDPHAELNYLVQRIQRALDLQIPLMARLLPHTETGLTSLPLDPDNMLSQAFVAREQPKVSAGFGSAGPRAALLCADSQAVKDGLLAQARVDRCAFTPDGQLLRAEDETAAKTLLPKLVEAGRAEVVDHDVASPEGVPNARCFEQKQAIWAEEANVRFVCFVSFRRYVALVASNEEKDARQRAAVQYAILANSA
jgi:hypothetical protein